MARFLSKASKSSFKLVLAGLAIFLFGAINYHRVRVLSFTGSPQKVELSGDVPVKLSIPSIEIDLDVDGGEIKNGVWQTSYNNATFLTSSAPLAANGNTVIYGHNKKGLLGNLPYLSIGQKIILTNSSGESHMYEVYQKDFVNADRVDLVSPTNYEELTIFTCWGLFDIQRVVVKAKPVSK